MLEPIQPGHAAKLFDGLQDERIYRYEVGEPPASVSVLELRYEVLAKRRSPDSSQIWLNWAVRQNEGEYVGLVQATISGSRALIGYDFFPEFWKRGFATETCAEMIRFLTEEGITRIEATVDVENAASIRLLERLGFSRAATSPSDDMPGHTDYRYVLDRTRR